MAGSKHWVITGASRGIGLEMVKQLLHSDEQVTALARNCHASKALQSLLLEYPARLKVLEADVTKDLDLDRAVKAISDTKVDVLINNAGVYQRGDGGLSSMDPKIIEQTLMVNTLGPMRVTKAFLPLLKKASGPIIVNITSRMGSIEDNTSGGSIGYRMSKAALNMFTKSLAVEYPEATVLSLHPGWVQTDMGGSTAPVQIPDSARGLLNVIRESDKSSSGKFFDYKGENLQW